MLVVLLTTLGCHGGAYGADRDGSGADGGGRGSGSRGIEGICGGGGSCSDRDGGGGNGRPPPTHTRTRTRPLPPPPCPPPHPTHNIPQRPRPPLSPLRTVPAPPHQRWLTSTRPHLPHDPHPAAPPTATATAAPPPPPPRPFALLLQLLHSTALEECRFGAGFVVAVIDTSRFLRGGASESKPSPASSSQHVVALWSRRELPSLATLRARPRRANPRIGVRRKRRKERRLPNAAQSHATCESLITSGRRHSKTTQSIIVGHRYLVQMLYAGRSVERTCRAACDDRATGHWHTHTWSIVRTPLLWQTTRVHIKRSTDVANKDQTQSPNGTTEPRLPLKFTASETISCGQHQLLVCYLPSATESY
jgi:hypothetical protein